MNIFNNFLFLTSAFIGGYILFHKKIRNSQTWHATVIPLASIIGSGFLVSAPLLFLIADKWAVFLMLLVVLVAYAIGSSIRFNIKNIEPIEYGEHPTHWIATIEWISRPTLGVAYIISVAFYLKLLATFALYGLSIDTTTITNILTTLVLLLIGITGKRRGLNMLEWFEVYSVNTKLAIISAMLLVYFAFNIELLATGDWVIVNKSTSSIWTGFRQVLGMFIVVQGFEVSRYLGHAYSAPLRIRTMQYAQWISAVIYVIFVALASIVIQNLTQITETSIIDLCKIVASTLPTLLIVAAIMSQFSAAIADTIGSASLLNETSHNKIKLNDAYLIITIGAILLTWLTNIFEIITIASKAFAIYYALQITLSLIMCYKTKIIKHRNLLILFYTGLLIAMLGIIILGIPIEKIDNPKLKVVYSI